MEVNEEYLRNILEKVAKKYGIEKWHYLRKKLNEEVVNYLGKIIPISLIDDSNCDSINLVIKRAPVVPSFKELICSSYKREIYVYATLLPIFKSLQTNICLKKLMPQCYYTEFNSDDKLLVLQDMNEYGFGRYCKESYLDADHINVSMKSLAKFHALSFIMNEKYIEIPYKNVLRPFLSEHNHFYYRVLEFALIKYSALFAGSQHEDFFHKLRNNFDHNINSSVFKARKTVYVHGDFWKENILYKYDEANSPIDACLVDYQLTRVLSPAYDVLFLLMTADVNIRRQHFQTFLSSYYTTLKETLCSNGLDPQSIYSQDDFLHDVRLVFPLSFMRTFFSYLLWLDVEDRVTFITRESGLVLKMDEAKEITIKNIIVDLITDFTNFGYIN